mmetsp:Transcript_20619/g.26579  ORF Transcript_20619/g.26579 Transcript_20619/m.26579 type:complete len:236 (+) Transcript_20619:83-790(+)
MTGDDDDHALSDFLRDRLPQVGLDYDTYGPYVLPLLTEEETDPEEWDSVLELLQASSESHSDDDQLWIGLRAEIQATWAQHLQKIQFHQMQEKVERAQKMADALAEEKRISAQAALEAAERPQPNAAATAANKEADAAKRALIDRFGYEQDPDEEGGGGHGGGDKKKKNSGEDEDQVLTNQQIAAKAHHDSQQELKLHKGQTKKEEQAKTARAKMEKVRGKEDRKKRAVKGERKS